MSELDCYRELYGEVAYCIEHYYPDFLRFNYSWAFKTFGITVRTKKGVVK